MMRNRFVGLFVVLLAVIICGGLWSITSYSQKRAVPSLEVAGDKGSGGEIIAGYRKWTRVNPTPVVQEPRISLQCAPPTVQQTQLEASNPHAHKFISVYVNDIGRHAMLNEKLPHFPQGSVIVKEKLPAQDSSSPELLTVMVKREPGYDPEKGDWEYMTVEGDGTTVRGKLEKCQACHLLEKATDYVSRIYLPREVWEKLK
jgi:hypothetical protein